MPLGRRGFILATVLVHLPTSNQMAELIKADAPDLCVAHAKSSIIGYIYGVTPGLAIPIVFGLSRPFRQTMRERLVPKAWKNLGKNRKDQGHAKVDAVQAVVTPVAQPLQTLGMEILGPDSTKTVHLGSLVQMDKDSYELVSENGCRREGERRGVNGMGSISEPSTTTTSLDSLLIVDELRGDQEVSGSFLGSPPPFSYIGGVGKTEQHQ